MSDTTTHPPAETPVEPAEPETDAPAPAEQGAEVEAKPPDPPKPSAGEKRFAIMSAKLARMEAELAEARQRFTSPPPDDGRQIDPATREMILLEAQRIRDAERAQEKINGFHEAGRAAYSDWAQRCDDLQKMGADRGLAELFVDMGGDGARVAAALHDDPAELERIAAIKGERGRAIALGKYAAALEDRPALPARTPSRAPPPSRPVTGTARVAFDESSATSEQLVRYYSAQAMKARGL